ncbi:hypothetical protein BDM02DRAFT_1402911 [Thelephora ganbajun]|uniref:Uncharacterized protein n=1 Tax=Thelephora ganbajun TaxID=370292 RepID=A0ACB6Z234_THEGA|nr:hypothetical protein BDM02DRAFT_1402911 [Thelephora ganbajun]
MSTSPPKPFLLSISRAKTSLLHILFSQLLHYHYTGSLHSDPHPPHLVFPADTVRTFWSMCHRLIAFPGLSFSQTTIYTSSFPALARRCPEEQDVHVHSSSTSQTRLRHEDRVVELYGGWFGYDSNLLVKSPSSSTSLSSPASPNPKGLDSQDKHTVGLCLVNPHAQNRKQYVPGHERNHTDFRGSTPGFVSIDLPPGPGTSLFPL